MTAGIKPADVCIIRHHTPERGKDFATLHDLWRADAVGFTRYQATQESGRPLFRQRKIWAAFVCPAPDETMFIGLFDATLSETRKADWLCDYRGDEPGDGEAVDIFTTQPRADLAEHAGVLRVDWPSENRRSWARKAEGLTLRISAQQPATPAALLTGDALVAALERHGFARTRATKKLVQLRRGDLVVYVKRETEARPLVIHPHFVDIAEELRAIGVEVPVPARSYVNSNLRAFPAYHADHRATEGRHGFAVGVGATRLGALLDLLERSATIPTPEGVVRAVAPEEDPLTERERLQAARVGQGEFRDRLMIYWNGACPVAGVDHAALLRASHIKAWREATNAERLDPFNGILLCAHIDALFDRHLITFEDDGRLCISSSVSDENRSRLGLEPAMRITGLDARHGEYLAHHRSRFQP
ncbi:HNH endonuclease [Sphingomonas sp. 28-63-12]|uniref:HNH endonuclease n=1 Tax=Sphingomonas sp. 28-63-12 TaxID=1970434 RepID=UPI0035A86CE7